MAIDRNITININDTSPSTNTAYVDAGKENKVYNKAQVNELVEDLKEGALGSISPSQTLQQLNALPDGNYYAAEAGTYAFGVTVPNGWQYRFSKIGTIWKVLTKIEMPMQPVDQILNIESTNAIANKEVAKQLEKKIEAGVIGIDFILIGTNLIDELTGSDLNNLALWGAGFLQSNGAINNSTDWFYSKNYYKLIKNTNYHFKIGTHGNAAVVFYDHNFQVINFRLKGSTSTATYFEFDELIGDNDVFVRFSHYKTAYSTSNIYIHNTTKIEEVTSDVFVTTNDLPEKSLESLAGVYDDGTNFISELTGSNLNDPTLWNVGLINAAGNNAPTVTDYRSSKKFYFLQKGVYDYRLSFSGNAKLGIYNLDKTFNRVIDGASGASHVKTITLDSDCFVRLSAVGTSDSSLFYIKNKFNITKKVVNTENNFIESINSFKKNLIQFHKDAIRPKTRIPLLTIISDDGHVDNSAWFIPILEEFKVKASFAIIGNFTKRANDGLTTSYYTSSQVKSLYDNGHDIMSHTWTHQQSWSTILTLEQIDEEMKRTKVYLESIINAPVNLFVSPYGLRTPAIDNIISKYYDANFIINFTDHTVNLPLDTYYVNRLSADCDETTYSLLWETSLKPALDKALLNKEWLILCVHPQFTQYKQSSNPNYLARQNEFRKVLQYCKDNGIEVTTAKQGFDYYKNILDIGVKRFDQIYYKLSIEHNEDNNGYYEK